MKIVVRIICVMVGYVFGLLQTGYLYGKMKNVDIREFGSGNSGTTNCMRVLGKKAGMITFLGDALKGLFCGILIWLVCIYALDYSKECTFVYVLYGGLGVVLGHNYPFYMGFKGGKGIAATSGVVASLLDWKLTLLIAVVFFVVLMMSKYVSLGSMCLTTAFFIYIVIMGNLSKLPVTSSDLLLETYILVFIFTGLSIFKHRSNISRIIQGTERKIGQKKENI